MSSSPYDGLWDDPEAFPEDEEHDVTPGAPEPETAFQPESMLQAVGWVPATPRDASLRDRRLAMIDDHLRTRDYFERLKEERRSQTSWRY